MNHQQMDKRKLRGENSKQKIIQSAKLLFVEHGFKDTTISLISKTAETAYGTVYTHFPGGKDEIFLNIMDEILDRFYLIADMNFVVTSKEESLTFTRNNIKSFLDLALEHQQILKVFHEAIGLSHIINQKWSTFVNNYISKIAENIELAKVRGLTREEAIDSEIIAGMLFFTGEKYMWKIALRSTNKEVETISENLAKMYVNGLYK
ncbi:TetR/AcrR family transcriptional regulator [Mesobacillus maritimus]|uniref:TetR/AcrR family transcriptional regulator n=1 Tax=Mesobacillus maritimus TaxID=1643336 RepID=UPI00203E81CE|nr:TetR/AcrR family transcriptional regulator [Mesobacillus maritimus]MCM3584369.1 TetR/AcrR family transcriptional regulator [Mesobacillus maritimus]MCM3669213.1 TetR/AcrR family transcriptional regulator [Mesobacillus maritimus]